MDSNENLLKLKEDFLENWPINRLESMTIEDYTNLNKTSFCYHLEHVTLNLGSIKGGSSYKFGIYRIGKSSEVRESKQRMNDGEYAWYTKYGNTSNDAFSKIRKIVYEVAKLSSENNLDKIDKIDLGDAVKWKIAFLYSKLNIVNIFKHSSLKISAEYLGYTNEDESYLALNRYILSKQGDQNFFDFTKSLWKVFDNRDEKRDQFYEWLKKTQLTVNSGKASSYLRAIDILENEFDKVVYRENDVSKLNKLYDDLIIHQRKENGKYYYDRAKSYGLGGFYSSAISTFIEFLEANFDTSKEENDQIDLIMDNEKTIELNQILYGPPGTGKTFNTINEALKIVDPEFYKNHSNDRIKIKHRFNELTINPKNEYQGQIGFVTFHQSFSYEDFVEGIKPINIKESESIRYHIEEGIFKKICRIASKCVSVVKNDKDIEDSLSISDTKTIKNKNYVLIIDEINRGNISSIFGELITLIEKDKREGMDEELMTILPYSKAEFKVPHNLYIIGTMNTADRSIEALDTALRRRFVFKEIPPKPDLIKEIGRLKNSNGFISDINIVAILQTLNKRIEKLIDKDHKIGHSYFLDIKDENDLKMVFKNKIIPMLEEYFFGDLGKISLVLGSSFISKVSYSDTKFALDHEYDRLIADDLNEKSVYCIQDENNWDFKSIYES